MPPKKSMPKKAAELAPQDQKAVGARGGAGNKDEKEAEPEAELREAEQEVEQEAEEMVGHVNEEAEREQDDQMPRKMYPVTKDYSMGGEIGRGATAEVYEGRQLKEPFRKVAIKVVDKSDAVALEVRIHRRAQLICPNGVVELIDVYDGGSKVNMVLERFDETLMKKIDDQTNSEHDLLLYSRSLLQTLHALHTADPSIIHRDLKASNVGIFHDKTVKLFDFGVSTEVERGGKAKSRVGTIGHAPPQQQPDPNARSISYSSKADLFALGATLFNALNLNVAFFPSDTFETDDDLRDFSVLEHVKVGEYEHEQLANVSAVAKDFVDSLMVRTERGRPSAKKALEHEWFKNPEQASTELIKWYADPTAADGEQ